MERTVLQASLLGAVQAHDEENEIFIVAGLEGNTPHKLAFGVLAAPISGGDDAVASKLALLMQMQWPTGTLMQFCAYASPDLVGITSAYRAERSRISDPILRGLTDAHVDFIAQGANNPIDKATGIRLRDTRVAICVQIPFKGAAPTEQDLQTARDMRIGFEQALKSAQVGSIRITPRLYLRFMETILNQGVHAAWKDSPLTAYDDKEVLCSQIIDPGSSIEVDEDGLWLGGSTRVRVLSPKRYPDLLYFGMAMRYFCDPKQGARGIRENALVTLNVFFPEPNAAQGALEKGAMWANHQSSTPIARFISFFREKKQSLDAVLNEVKQGDRVVRAYLSMAIFTQGAGSDEKSRKETEQKSLAATMNAKAYWREFGFQMMEDRFMVLPFFSQLLPFAADDGLIKSMERYKTMSGKHATFMMPLMGQWRGSGTPLITLFARDGQVQPISLWDTDAGMNFLVAAQTGKGKSVFSQNLLQAMRSINGRAWVIDVGDSYNNLCLTLGGQYINFGGNSHICINPFNLVRDFNDEVDMLVAMVAIMAAPQSGLDDFRLAGAKRVLSQVFSAKGTQMTIDDLAEALRAEDRQELRDLGLQLHSFTSVGEYGRYFNGPNNVAVDNPFTVLELGALKAMPHLQRVVLLSLMYQIGQAVYMGNRETRQVLLVDEAWQLLASDETSDFIEKAYRQFRKHDASVGIVTQSVRDIFKTKGGQAISANSSFYFLLGQKSDEIDAVKAEKQLPFGDWGYEMLKTVHTVPKQYSEVMCVTPYGTGIGRLVLSNFQKVLFSTSAEDVVALRKLREQGMTIVEAVAHRARELFGDDSGAGQISSRKAA